MKGDRYDPKALIREAYCMEGIGEPECRTIFLDWALSLPEAVPVEEALAELIARHVAQAPDHPMSAVLRDGVAPGRRPERRGGWRGRRGQES